MARLPHKIINNNIQTISWWHSRRKNGLQESEWWRFYNSKKFKDFIKVIIENGLHQLISFDNDLGLDENENIAEDGYAAAKRLIYESGLDLRN